MSMWNWTIRFLPEIDRFPTDEARADALLEVQLLVQRNTRFWFMHLAAAAVMVVAALTSNWLLRRFGIIMPVRILTIIVATLGVGLPLILNNWKRHVVAPLRRKLLESGIAICMQCGYDLTGNRSGRCPECGETAQKVQSHGG